MPLFLESQWQARTEEREEKEKKEKEKKKEKGIMKEFYVFVTNRG